ncbi:MAG: glycosyltransferase family 2 protein [Thiogranum sp.]
MEFSVVVPVYNEAGNVRPLLTEINRAVRGTGACEVIYVDDGSDDDTLAELRRAQADFPALRVFHHALRSGQSSALLSGVRAARAPWVVTLDGDGQNDPADIHLLLKRLQEDNGLAGDLMLVGHRTRRQDDRIRCWSSRLANLVRRGLLSDDTPDTGCGLKLFPRDLLLSVPAFDHMHRFLPALVQRQGARVISVPVRHRARRCGVSKYGIHNRLWVGLVDLAGVMWLQRRRIGRSIRHDGVLSRIEDELGVYWLRRRPCTVSAEEEG